MISRIKKYQRGLIGVVLAMLFLMAGLAVLEQGMELTGLLLLPAALGTLLYLPLFWFFTREKDPGIIQALFRKEILALFVFVAILSLIGAIESFSFYDVLNSSYLIYTIFFVELLVFLFVFLFVNFIKPKSPKAQIGELGKYEFPKQLYWIFAIGNGIALVVLIDNFEDDEFLLTLIAFYFLGLFFLLLRWILQQIVSIINLKKEQTKTELMHLQSQVNPHFFFNMLNNLYGWVERDPKTAQALILQLSDMMRYSIYDGQADLVSLDKEIAYLKNYIDLHKMRYLKEIKISFEIDLQEEHLKVMPLLFIILLENAFKHGVENLRENAFINIAISTQKEAIHFSVENNFDPSQTTTHSGIGLKNLQRRLELVYPKKHTLSLSAQENIYRAQLTLNPS